MSVNPPRLTAFLFSWALAAPALADSDFPLLLATHNGPDRTDFARRSYVQDTVRPLRQDIEQLKQRAVAFDAAIAANRAATEQLDEQLDNALPSIQDRINQLAGSVERISQRTEEMLVSIGLLPKDAMSAELKSTLREAVIADLNAQLEAAIKAIKREMLCEISDNNPELDLIIEC